MNRSDKKNLAIAAAAGGALLLAKALLNRNRDYDFRGKTVLITGGSRGLGLVLARQLAERGARLVICARDGEELRRAERDLLEYGATVLAVPCDLTDHHQAKQLTERAIEHFGSIDVLVNNAGIIAVSPIEHVTMDDYHRVMDANFWSAVNLAYHVVPHMQQRGSGRIVNISSIGGKIGVPHLAAYCASKFAMVGWSRAIRAELMKDGIVVTTICPGLMRTGSPRHGEFKGQNALEYAWFKISDSLPVLSVSAEHAAADIIEATRRGDAEFIISAVAKLGVFVDQNFPDLSGEALALAGRLLPKPGGIGEAHLSGAQSESEATQSTWTATTDRAAERNNEMSPAY